jgi:hypothetical protein
MRNLEHLAKEAEYAQNRFNNLMEIGKKNLELIKKGCEFGYPDPFDPITHYFKLTLLRVVDEDKCLIEVEEMGRPGHTPEIVDTTDVTIYEEVIK